MVGASVVGVSHFPRPVMDEYCACGGRAEAIPFKSVPGANFLIITALQGVSTKLRLNKFFMQKQYILKFYLDWDLMGNVTRPPRTPDKGDGVACDNKGSGNSLGLASLIDCIVSRAKTVAIK